MRSRVENKTLRLLSCDADLGHCSSLVWGRSGPDPGQPSGPGQPTLARGPAKQGQGHPSSGPTLALGGPVRVGPRARRARPNPWTVYMGQVNPHRLWVGYTWVRVRVAFLLPVTHLYNEFWYAYFRPMFMGDRYYIGMLHFD